MSIQSEINRLQQNVSDAFTAVGNKGGTVPDTKNSGNLAEAIHSIPEGVELNFEVVGGTVAPSAPEENTIWVNTTTEISSVVFCAPQAAAKDGRVWIALGTSSPASFQPIPSGTDGYWIYIYPLEAKQYINGAWVRKTAKTWKNGAWVDWVTYIYNRGDPSCSFARKEIRPNSSFTSPAEYPTVDTYGTHYYIYNAGSSSSGSSGVAYVNSKIDLTNVSTLYIEGDFYPPSTQYKTYPYIGIWSAFGTYAADNLSRRVSPCSETGTDITTTVMIPVDDLTGEYYIGFCFYAQANTECGVTIRKIYYE